MNGSSSADMSTAAANGHAEGYQAGYADAVKVVETISTQQPVAEIAWSDDGYKIGLLGPLRAHRLPIGTKLYAAPVAAAPVQPRALASSIAELEAFLGGECVEPLTLAQSESAALVLQELKRLMASTPAAPDDGLKEVAERAVLAFARVAQELGIDPAGGANAALGAIAKLRTPAAPGIDLEQFRLIANSWIVEAAGIAAEAKHACADELLALIDASPKGGSADPRGLKLPCLPFAVFDEFGVGADDRVADYGRACAAAAMQATSAEVGA